MRFSIIFIAAMVLFAACKKADLQNSYVGLYTSSQYKLTSLPKMYTKAGEVTDRATVNRYIDSLPQLNSYFFRNMDTVIAPGNDSIRFITPDTAALQQANRWDKRVVKPQGDYLYLYPLDTFRYVGNFTPNPFDEAVSQIGLYKPYFKVTNYGNLYLISSYEAAIVQWQSDKIVLPLMNYNLRHSEPNGPLYGNGRTNYNNLFDPSVVTVLKNRDTLIVQTFELLFKKVQ